MRYLLDTNAWIRLFSQPALLSAQARAILSAEASLGLSDISLWEVSQLHYKGKISFSQPLGDWLLLATPANLIVVLPVNVDIAIQAYSFSPQLHGDPADRLISATAVNHGLTLVTSDHLLIAHPQIPTLRT